MVLVTSKYGLVCSHGSKLDEAIPRPKLPKTALPPELRKKMGLKPRTEDDSSDIYKAGSGVLNAAGSARDGKYLKKGSGVPASVRTSGLSQNRSPGAKAVVSKARIGDEYVLGRSSGNTQSSSRSRGKATRAQPAQSKATKASSASNQRTGKPLRAAKPVHDSRYDEVL